MVAKTVAVDQGLCAMALTTTSASTAIRMIMMKSVPDHRRGRAEAAQLVAREVGEAPAVAARGAEQHQHVLHAAGQHRADQQPQRARQVAELRGERRADQGTRARDRGEVVAEHDRAVGRHEVAAVVEPLGGRRPRRIETADAGRDPAAVEAVADEVRRQPPRPRTRAR